MFGFHYIKVEPTTYLMQYSRGQLRRKGAGMACWYFAPSTSLLLVPGESIDVPFMFSESSADFQLVTVQGQLVYRIAEPEKIAKLMNYAVDNKSLRYLSEDPDKLNQRVINVVQVTLRAAIEQQPLRAAINADDVMVEGMRQRIRQSSVLQSLGVELLDLSILAIKPSPETSRALEASVREQLLQDADEAIYRRRNAAIDQERQVKENELNTELAVQAKHQQLEQDRLQADRQVAVQKSAMAEEQLSADIELEDKRQQYVNLQAENRRVSADASAYEVEQTMQALSKVDVKVLEAMTLSRLEPEQLMAQAFRELAGGAEKIGQLNITPDLLQSMLQKYQ